MTKGPESNNPISLLLMLSDEPSEVLIWRLMPVLASANVADVAKGVEARIRVIVPKLSLAAPLASLRSEVAKTALIVPPGTEAVPV